MVIIEWRTQNGLHRGRLINITQFDYIVSTEGGEVSIPRRCGSIVDITEDKVKEVSSDKIDWDSWDWDF